MLKKKNTQTDELSQQTFLIKMPVYTTNIIESIQDLFPNISYDAMLDMLINKIKKFTFPIISKNKSKTIVTVVNNIDFELVKIGDISSLLLRIESYKTNLYEGYFESDEKIRFNKDSKIGSDSNYILIYPRIEGYTYSSYSCYFLMLVYEDPTKANGEVSRLAKIIANKVLELSMQNIKLPNILAELKNIKIIPELCFRYYSIDNEYGQTNKKYIQYQQECKIKTEKKQEFKNMPFDVMEELLSESDDNCDYQRKETSIILGKTEYRIKKRIITEAQEVIKETAEKIFNATSAISQKELDKVYDKQFMLEKMANVITNYISLNV